MPLVGGDWTHISTKLFLLLGFCISVINGDGCEKVKISNTMFHESLEGTYLRLTSLCAGRNVYRQQDGKEYLFYRNVSGKWHGWMIGDESCIENDGIIVETKAYYPEEATEIWQEWYFENWYYSKLIEVKCTNKVSSTTLIGVTVLGLLILVVVAFTAVRCRAMMHRRQLAPQPVPRTHISTVTPGTRPPVHNRMQPQPRYPGPQTARPLRPRGPLRPHGPHFARPPMRPGFGHGPMMPSGYGPNPRMPPYNPRAMVPPGYLGYSGPLAPAYPEVLGPPPPYRPVEYQNTGPAYPPPEVAIHGQQQYSDQQQQQQHQQQQQQQLQQQLQQQYQQQMQRQSSEDEKEAAKEDERNEVRQVHSVQSVVHGHADNDDNQVTADVAD